MTLEAEFVSPLGKDALLFRRMHSRDELGRLPELNLELLRPTKSAPIQPKDLLGQNAGIRVLLDDGSFRYLNGVVTRFERGGVVGRFDIYRLELRPWLWQLTLGADCRIFQDKTVVQILDQVLGEYASAARVEKKLTGSFRTRPYTVQYRESDFDFVSRLMEEEGIYYFFTHASERHTLVLCNGPTGHLPMPGASLVWAPVQTSNELREDIVTDWSRSHALRSLKYTHTDYAADAPTADLTGSAQRDAPYPKPNDLEVYDYPGGQEDLAMAANTGAKQQEAKRTAQLRVDAFETGHSLAAGISPYRQLTIGTTFTFKDHPQDNGGYLVTTILSEMEFAGYEANPDQLSTSYNCRFDAVPKAVAFQPERSIEPALVRGPQTATVVGPQGDEIFTDKYGRVKVQFHWDRLGKKDAKSSCWVRVSQPWAGKGFGFVALPRIGDEVVVEFLEGNPDRPLITGRVYNADNMPPWELPAQATVSGVRTRSSQQGGADNFNELRFDDLKGSEYIWFQAEKNYHQLVKNDSFQTVKNDLWTDVEKNSAHHIGEQLSVEVGKVATVSIVKDTHLKIGGDLNLAITGALNLDTKQAVAFKGEQAIALGAGKGLDIVAGAAMNLSATSAVSITGKGVVIDGGTQLCIMAGGAFITLDSGGVTIQGSMVKINSGGGPGSAEAAQDPSPAQPEEPAQPKENTDPLAS
jgi:type VI secretion system secreted protein VgrG